MPRRVSVGVALAVTAVIAGVALDWGALQSVWQLLRRETPHQRYARSLHEGGLAHTALATEWLTAADRALLQPTTLAAPFTEDALVDPARPLSLGYAVFLKRGQRLDAQVTVATDTPGRVFVDLFETDADGAPNRRRPVASALEAETLLSHEARRSGVYVLRVQPELLRGGHVRVHSAPAPALSFPVSGDGASIQSIYGDPRDAGSRSHEGLDIFAPRGTPVLAASDGVVTKVGENRLGGKVVWVWNPSRGVRLYYAHLQDQLVRPGALVSAGDPLGTVGNTGNAKFTAPHLHFGMYEGGGPIDPDAYIRPVPSEIVNPDVKASALGQWMQTRRPASLRAAPSPSAAVVDTLPAAWEIRIEGAVGRWVRTTAGGQLAFLQARDISTR